MRTNTALKNITSQQVSPPANSVIQGDCAEILQGFASESVDVVVTSPPYFQQREYTGAGVGMESTVDHYLANLLEGFKQMVRALKPTGSILYNIGDKIDGKRGTLLIPYQFALLAAKEVPDLSLLNHITWIKSNPTPRQFARRLVSSTEPFFHFVKSPHYFYSPDDFFPEEKKETLPLPLPARSRLGESYFDKIRASNLTKEQKRMAENDIKAVIDEVKNGLIQSFRVKILGMHAPAFGGQSGGRNTQMKTKGYTIIRIMGKPLKKDAVTLPVQSNNSGGHPAVFPLALIRELIKLTCPPDGIVLDPYCGSGTTLEAAKEEKRKFVGIEISPEYCRLSKKRIA